MIEMTIDEAIKHCWDITAIACKRCADEHAQLATWLEELNEYQSIGTPEQCREAVERTRWIPVSERMPEGIDACNYIVSIENCLGLPCKVISWMPLPEPYHIAKERRKVGGSE